MQRLKHSQKPSFSCTSRAGGGLSLWPQLSRGLSGSSDHHPTFILQCAAYGHDLLVFKWVCIVTKGE